MNKRFHPALALALTAWSSALAIACLPSGAISSAFRSPASDASASPDCDAWSISGRGDYGDFHGQLQLRADGSAVRVVRYETPLPNGLQLEELWLGKKESPDTARFELVSHRFLSRVGEKTFTKDDFAAKQSIEVQALGEKLDSCLPITDEADRREEKLISDQQSSPLLVKIVENLLLGKIIERYRQTPEVAPYLDNPEFKNGSHFLVRDFTDREFYRRDKGVLRVRNEVLGDAAILEAELRRAAFVASADEKAHRFDQETPDESLNSLGIVTLRSGQSIIPDGDAALWTGMYVASQFARYQVTGEPQALENAKRSLDGLLLLLDITGDPTSFARTAMKPDPAVNYAGWRQGSGKYSDLMYLPGGNNDMLHGVVTGLIWGYRALPSNDPQREQVLAAMRRIVPLHLRGGGHPNPVYSYGLKALADHDPDAYQSFLKGYLSNDNIESMLGVGHGFYVDGVADWSGVNLSMVGNYAELLLTHELARAFPNTGIEQINQESGEPLPSGVTSEWIESRLKQNLLDMEQTYRSTGRDFICILAYAVNRSKMGEAPSECRDMLDEIPIEIPTDQALAFDSRLRPEFVASPYPAVPWKFVGNPNESFAERFQGNRIFPFFETWAYTSDLAWKEAPFSPVGARQAGGRNLRVDFLFTYWTDRLGEIR